MTILKNLENLYKLFESYLKFSGVHIKCLHGHVKKNTLTPSPMPPPLIALKPCSACRTHSKILRNNNRFPNQLLLSLELHVQCHVGAFEVETIRI